MAGRRMVNIRIIDSDNFLELPLSTQALYFHLLLRADDDGFINNPKRIQRMIGGSEDDFKLLIAKQYILTFSSGVIVIKHWRMHNCIKKDRYHETDCINEKNMLYLNENKTYTFEKPQCIQNGDNLEPEWNPSIGKVSLGKSSINNNILPEQAGQQKQEQQKLENDNKDFKQLYQGAREYHMPLKNGDDYVVTENDVERFEQLYPDLDIHAEMRKMYGWLISHKQKQKTKRGMPKFLNGWINRAYVELVQMPKAQANAPKPPIQHNFTQRDYDFDDLEQQLLRKQQEGM
jgi:hypothetical protein